LSVLQDKRCYLSGPIENDNVAFNWRIDPKNVLINEFHIDLFDPFEDPKQQWVHQLKDARQSRDFDAISKMAKNFVRKDLTMVDRCDFLIAYLPHRVYTTGTHHEIISSNSSKKPTLIVCDGDKINVPAWYYGFIDHNFMFDNWDQLYNFLRDVNDGKYIDNDRFWFMYGVV
jgi:hypothetical protein